MNKNTKGIIAVAIVGILGYLAYKKFGKGGGGGVGGVLGKPNNREVVANYLYSVWGYSKEREDFSKSADQDYIDLWAEAIMKGKDTFQHKGNTIVTKTGRVQR